MKHTESHKRASTVALVIAGATLVLACVSRLTPETVEVHRWWGGLGPVLPHETFPADCALCHVGEGWQSLEEDFSFDHEAETGFRLDGAHTQARCLRCHNDRGPVSVFERRSCAGCHEDVHLGQLGGQCTDCHVQVSWNPYGQVELHNRTRFPLVGVHAATACFRCHPGAEVGNFVPADPNCLTCHAADLARTTNHLGLGWVDDCQRCHQPTAWEQAFIGD